jgi:hypothetical protein
MALVHFVVAALAMVAAIPTWDTYDTSSDITAEIGVGAPLIIGALAFLFIGSVLGLAAVWPLNGAFRPVRWGTIVAAGLVGTLTSLVLVFMWPMSVIIGTVVAYVVVSFLGRVNPTPQ